MTKKELFKEYTKLLEEKGMSEMFGVTSSSKKTELQNAINCLKATDEELNDYLTVVKLAYANIYKAIIDNDSSWKTHYHNRLYVYDTARSILGI